MRLNDHRLEEEVMHTFSFCNTKEHTATARLSGDTLFHMHVIPATCWTVEVVHTTDTKVLFGGVYLKDHAVHFQYRSF